MLWMSFAPFSTICHLVIFPSVEHLINISLDLIFNLYNHTIINNLDCKGVFMDKNDLIKRCLKFQDAVETYPFKDKTYDEYAVLRHKTNGKWFGLVFYLDNRLCINLKCNPVDSAILRDEYKFITPAWHMNKTHWIMVEVNKSSKDLLDALIKESFELTANKRKSK